MLNPGSRDAPPPRGRGSARAGPKLVSTNVGMNPLLTLMSMYIGYRVLSVGGLILGPLIMLFVMSLYKAGVFDTPIAIVKQVFKKTGQTLNAVKEYLLSDN